MSANPIPNLHPRVRIVDDGEAIRVTLDGAMLSSLLYGLHGHAEKGEATVTRESALSLAGVYANVLINSLPPLPVEVAIRATVIAYVTGEGVSEVHILPDQEEISMKHVHDANGNDEVVVEAAVTYVDENVWEPLENLPTNVVWEG